ncbi:MAG: hypothetical protein ACD_50C00117G0015 [uncultured bacterium]|nr:MAG: hypothetical protein ACD_50C00117G0015 [uncultured bacterium]OGH14761.1 MAG: hypothetical protein A2687_02825 [Candidatus Levybacteria bacterium RIFCSPHIGHO2_01_FULL_38_26]
MYLNRYSKKNIIFLTGMATFFFGFGAGAILNIFLLAINSPLVLQFRTSLMYISSILGDGIILPVVNMIAVSFLFKNQILLGKSAVILGLFFGFLVTSYFHVSQALQGLVNWSMPKPWEWNFLGAWHAFYMFSVASLLSVFYIVLILVFKKQKKLAREAFFVTAGIIFFLILLKLDYIGARLI